MSTSLLAISYALRVFIISCDMTKLKILNHFTYVPNWFFLVARSQKSGITYISSVQSRICNTYIPVMVTNFIILPLLFLFTVGTIQDQENFTCYQAEAFQCQLMRLLYTTTSG